MLLKINLARNALRYIIRTYNIKKIYIPYYICPTIRQAVLKENCKPIFYHIDDNFMPEIEFSLNEYILYPNYFGICDKNTDLLTKKYPFIIIDNAHSFYSAPKGFACFNSARKFMPVFNGSYLWIQTSYLKLNTQYSPVIYDLKYENTFESYDIEIISDELDKYIQSFNLQNNRKIKFLELHKKYGNENNLKIDINCKSPFCYPYLADTIEDADKIVNELKKGGQTIFRYWNSLPKTYNEYKFYSRLIPIPI